MSRGKLKTSELADLIRQVRMSRGLSQAAFGRLIQRGRDAVQSYELGRSTPKAMPLSRILRLAPPALVEPIRKHLLPMVGDLAEDALIDPETPEMEFRSQALQLMKKKLDELQLELKLNRRRSRSSRFSEETIQQLHDALDVILERAPSTVVEKTSQLLTRLAGIYGDRNRP